jgi:hypothetical protein
VREGAQLFGGKEAALVPFPLVALLAVLSALVVVFVLFLALRRWL